MELQAEQLQDHLDRIAAGQPVGDVFSAAAGAGADGQVALIQLALHLSEILPAQADPVFRAQLQARLQAALAEQPRAARSSGDLLRHGRRWFLRLAAATVVLALALGTAVRASADSLPGAVLYPVKRVAEEARLALAWTATLRAQAQLDIANARIAEIARLVEQDAPVDPVVIEVLITAYGGLVQTNGATTDPALAGEVARAAAGHAGVLGTLARAADSTLRSRVDQAVRALGVVVTSLEAGAGSATRDAAIATSLAPTPGMGAAISAPAGGSTPLAAVSTATPVKAESIGHSTATTAAGTQAATATASVATAGLPQAVASATGAARPAATRATAPAPTDQPPSPVPLATSGGGNQATSTPNNPDRNPRETSIAEKTRQAATQEAHPTRDAPRRPNSTQPPESTPHRPIPTSPPVVEPTREAPPLSPSAP